MKRYLSSVQIYVINTPTNLGVSMKLLFSLVVISASLLSGCATKSVDQNSRPHFVNNAVITEPLEIDYQSELAVAKLSQIINHVKLDNEKMAQMLYDRGVIFDSMGLRTLAQLDFRRALEYKPAFADAYNFIGIHMTLIGQYSQAFEVFDNVLEIEPEHSYVYLNRGIALHYFGKHELAADDLEAFLLRQPNDPYRAIWLYLAEYEINPEDARLRLIYNSSMIDKNKWSYQLIDLYLGNIDEKQFIENMSRSLQSPRELVDRLCEGYFYLAKLKLREGDEETAKNYFRLALATNVFEFVEHKYAKLELAKLYQKAKQRYNPVKQLPVKN